MNEQMVVIKLDESRGTGPPRFYLRKLTWQTRLNFRCLR
jgi:hypothetical protein